MKRENNRHLVAESENEAGFHSVAKYISGYLKKILYNEPVSGEPGGTDVPVTASTYARRSLC